MKKLTSLVCVLLLCLTMVSVPTAIAAQADYTGNWVCRYVDLGDGVLLTEYEGQKLPEMIFFTLYDDGTALLTSMGEEQTGSWSAADNGILINADNMDVPFVMQDSLLVNQEDDVTMYFEKVLPETQTVSETIDFTGDWACQSVDLGDGIKLTEYEGVALPEAMHCTLNADGTASFFSFSIEQNGTWQPTTNGITLVLDGLDVPFVYQDGQLVNNQDGVIMYFAKAEGKPKSGGFNDLVNIGKGGTPAKYQFAGTWNALTYEVSGMTLDIQTALPDGLSITLLADGTGSAQLTADYAQPLTWTETADGISLGNNSFLFNPAWDAETETLTLSYAVDIVRIGFQKADAEIAAPVASALPLVYTCDYFTIAFPADWVEDQYGVYNWDQYYTVQYDLNDQSGWSVSNLALTASVEEVAAYRSNITGLLEKAKADGKDTLDELVIDGVTFRGLTYNDYWSYAEYYARVPQAGITLSLSISSPETIADVLDDILASVRFTYPIPNPPLSDPPMPEDGITFIPSPASVSTASGYTLQAKWLSAGQPIIPTDLYSIGVANADDWVYLLTNQKLLSYRKDGDTLTAAEPLSMDQGYSFIDADTTGSVYLTDGYYSLITLLNGEQSTASLNGYLAMYPDGVWGLSFWFYNDVNMITFTSDGMATKPWVLSNLSDDTARKGRFSSIAYITISQNHIFVAGTDASTDYATRIAMYDLDGNELVVFGATDWSDDAYIGSVAGIVQTQNGILVQDGSYYSYKLFAMDGTFLGDIPCDKLLGTRSAVPFAMTSTEGGALAVVSQERDDKSATELLVFEITGF